MQNELVEESSREDSNFSLADDVSTSASASSQATTNGLTIEDPDSSIADTSDDGECGSPLCDELARLQAILAGLPQHVPSKTVHLRFANSSRPSSATYVERAGIALHRASLEYPQHAVELCRLEVISANLDLIFLADHEKRRLFVCARGTDRALRRTTLPRDLGNDALVALGFGPLRVKAAAAEYQDVCARLPDYYTFGCGHSLGATVIEWLALWAEAENGRRAFQRVDLFNPGSSPLRRLLPTRNCGVPLAETDVQTHRVPGDLVSWFHKTVGQKHVHPRLPQLSAHALGHFLPSADDAALAARSAVAESASKAIASVCGAQAAARAAVHAIGVQAVGRVVRAQKNMLLAEVAAATDAQGRPTSRVGPLANWRRGTVAQKLPQMSRRSILKRKDVQRSRGELASA